MSFFELLPSLLGVLFLTAILILCVVGFMGAVMWGMVFGGVGLKWLMVNVLDPAIDRIETFLVMIWNRTRTPRRFVGTVVRLIIRTWRLGCRIRRAFRRTVRFVMSPVDKLLDPHPRTQWSARFIGRWSLRFAMTATPVVLSLYAYVYRPNGVMPDIAVIMKWQPPTIGHMRDRNGVVVMRAFYEARLQLSASEFADPRYDHMRNALVAAEDKSFWTHHGVDWSSTIKEGIKNAVGLSKRGASGIDQQVVRNIFPKIREIVERGKTGTLTVNNPITRLMAAIKGTAWTNKATRKLPETRFAVWLEELLTRELGSRHAAKQLILTTYANFVNLGEGVYGVEYGAQRDFCKTADQLEPHEAAHLAALIPAPNLYSQIKTPEQIVAAVRRRNAVLRRMYEIGALTDDQLTTYRAKPLGICPILQGPKTNAPAAVKVALQEMKAIKVKGRTFTEEQLHRGDIEMTFTIDMRIQRAVNLAAYRHIYGDPDAKLLGFAGKYPGVRTPQVAIIVMRPNGEVLAMHGGFVPAEQFYSYRAFNRATEALPPTGSAFKAVDMFAAMLAGLKPDDMVNDERVCIRMNRKGVMHCFDNYKDEYEGSVSFRRAAAESLNGAFMSTMLYRAGGVPWVIKSARELGISSKLDPYPPTIIGSNGVTPLEMAKVFARIASGLKSEPFIVSRITARDGTVLYGREPKVQKLLIPGTTEPVPPEMLIDTQQLLRGTVRLPTGTGRSLNDSARFPVQVACKTGTANQHRAAEIGCFTAGPEGVVVFAWAGYDDFSSLPYEDLPIQMRATGGSVLGSMVRDIFLGMYGSGKPLGNPPPMPDEVELPIDEYLTRATPATDK